MAEFSQISGGCRQNNSLKRATKEFNFRQFRAGRVQQKVAVSIAASLWYFYIEWEGNKLRCWLFDVRPTFLYTALREYFF